MIEPAASDETTVLPQPGRGRLLAIMGAIVVVVLVVAFLSSGSLRNPLIVGAIVLIVSSVGIARSGIRCDAKGVGVQGLTLTHRFTWSEIVKFEHRESHGIGVVRKQDGWNQLVGPRTFGERSKEATEQLELQRRFHQGS